MKTFWKISLGMMVFLAFVQPGLSSPLPLQLSPLLQRQAQALGSLPTLSVAQWGAPASVIGNPPPKLSDVVSLAAGKFFCLALKQDGTVVGWGENQYGQASPPASLQDVVAIAAGENHSLALRSDGTVVGWGDDAYGQATPPQGLTNVLAIAAGGNFSLALQHDGTVIGWGDNNYGQAIPPVNLTNVVAIAAGYDDALALRRDGTVIGWGNISPSAMQGLTNVAAIAAGGQYSLALRNDSTVIEWIHYYNSYGYDFSAPVPGLTNVVAIAAGDNGFLALKNDGSVAGYGYGLYGEFRPPPELKGVVSIAAGSSICLALTTHPGAPLEPFAKIASTNQLNLSWTDNSDNETSFTVERALESENNYPGSLLVWTRIGTVGTDITNFTDETVVSNSTYYYRVQAHSLWGDSLYSDVVVAGMKSPPMPGNIRVTIGSLYQANLYWYDNFGYNGVPAGFQIERAPDNGGSPGTWTNIGIVVVNNATNAINGSFTDTHVTPASSWWYRVRAYNVFGDSDFSQPVKLDVAPPSVPDLFFARPQADQVFLSWYADKDSDGIDSFQIQQALDVGGHPGTWADIATIGASNVINDFFQYQDTDRKLGSTYWYRVRAHNWIGSGEYSSPVNATIVLPSAPSIASVQIGNAHEVNLSWYQSSADAAGFVVERAPDAYGQPGVWSEIGTTAVRYIGGSYYCSDTNVTALTTNWYRVRAFNAVGESDYSVPRQIQVIPPPKPNGFGAQAFRDQVKLFWSPYFVVIFPGQIGNSAHGLVSQFKIERAPDVGGSPGTWTQIAEVGGDAFAYTDTARPANTTWWYRIRPSNWVGDGGFTSPVSATIVPPSAPYALSIRIGSTNQVLVAWYDNYGDEDGFNLERAPDESGQPGAWSEIATIPATNLYYGFYIDTNVTAFTTNWYRVRAFNLIGQSDYTPAASVAILPPPAPTIAATASRDQIELTWNGPYFSYYEYYGEVEAFRVERAPDQNGIPGPWTEIASVPVTNQYFSYYSYTNSGLVLNNTYWYRVRAVNWTGLGEYSTPVSATIKLPLGPDSLSFEIGETNQIRLSWYESSSDVDGFRIERAADAGGNPGEWTTIGSIVASNFYEGGFTDTNVLAFSTNWYRVRSYNLLGDSEASSPLMVSAQPPMPPSPLYANPLANHVHLQWYDSNLIHDGVDAFQIERATDEGGSPGVWTTISTVVVSNNYNNNFEYTDAGLKVNTTYWYRVRAHNWIGNGDFGPMASATVVPPAAPYGLKGIIGTTNQIQLSWYENPADEEGFRIQRAPDVDGEPGAWTEIGLATITNASYAAFMDTNVVAFTTNWYRVCSFNVFGDSAFSIPSVVNVVPPPGPSGLVASVYRDQINLSWSGYFDNYASVTGYKVERALDVDGQPGPWSQVAAANSPSYSYHGLTFDKTYWYRVRAYNWIGDGDYSAAVQATIIPPAAPSSLYGQVGDATNQVDLSWYDAKTDEDGFWLERAPDEGGIPGTWTNLATISATNSYYSTYTDTNVMGYTTNWYRIRAFNSLGVSDYGPATSVVVIPPLPPSYFDARVFRDQARLSWYSYYYSSVRVDGYVVERALDVNGSPGEWKPIAQDASYIGSYIDSNLVANTTYWYRVRAFNWVGEGDPTPASNVTIVPPGEPDSVHGRVGDTNQVNLSWNDAQADEDGFQIERAPDVDGGPGAWTAIGMLQVTNAVGATFTDTNVTAQTTNWYRVRAFSQLGVSDYSPAASVAVIPPPAPYVDENVFRDRVRLSWFGFPYDYGSVDGYKIERAADVNGSPGDWTQIAQVSAVMDDYTDSNLTVNVVYLYRVRAYNWVGDGEYSSVVNAIILPPSAPTDLSGRIGSTNQVNLSWDQNSSDEDGFEIERAPDDGGVAGAWSGIGSIQRTNSYNGYFTDTNAMAFTTNWYRVRAFNSLGTSGYSSPARVAVVPLSAPGYLNANVARDQVNLSWSSYNNNGPVDGYKVERALALDGTPGPWMQIAQVASGVTSFHDTGLAVNTTYWYRVHAFNWVGDGDYSSVRSVIIVPPASPTSLSGVIGTTNQINLSWYQNPADEDGFEVERAPDVGGIPGTWAELGTIPMTNYYYGHFTDTNVTALTTNWYRVRAFNDLGTSDYSASVSVAALPPPAPNSLTTSAYRDQINLSWYGYYYNYGIVEKYKIERAPDLNGSPGEWTEIAQTSGTTTYYHDPGHHLNETCWYRVRASNWTGDGAYSSAVSATIVLPAVPNYLAGSLGLTNRINLSWDDYQADEDGFQIQRASDVGGVPGAWSEIGTLQLTNASYPYYTDTNVAGFTTNWYRVRAFNGLGVSDYTQPISVLAMPPAHPRQLTVATVTGGQVYLSWNVYSLNPIGGYIIERATNTDSGPGSWVQVTRQSYSYYPSYYDYSSYTDSTANSGGSYWYRVRAYNWVGESPNSPLASVNVSRGSHEPYLTDSATLHLWHLDETTTPCVDSGSGYTDLTSLRGGARLGASSIATLGGCLDLGGSDAVLASGGTSDPQWINYCDSYSGAFTYEAVVHIEFDPAQNYGALSAGGNGRNTPFEILSADGNTNSQRIFQFRMDPIGVQAFSGDTSSNQIRLEFVNLNRGSSVQHIITPLPTTGDQAIVSNAWYHVAVTYNGFQNSAGNIKFYWTRIGVMPSAASLLDDTQTMTNDLAGWSDDTVFAIGNVARNPAGNPVNPLNSNFPGRIDEVRISSIARSATDMLFTNSASPIAINMLPDLAANRGKIRINWGAISGFWYQVQFKTNLDQPNWADLGNPIQATNSSASWSELIGAEPERFYRIRPSLNAP